MNILITDFNAIEEILKRANVCRLALCDGNQPYIVPLCFGYDNKALYIHCATEGRKLDIIRKNNNVCFEVDINNKLVKTDRPCRWGFNYKSVIGLGKAVLVEDDRDKREALDILMRQFSADVFDYPQEVVNKTVIIKVEIESMTGKQSGY